MLFLKQSCVSLMGFVVILHEHYTQWYDSEQVYQSTEPHRKTVRTLSRYKELLLRSVP
jgi:hypothetical protein